MILGEKVVEMAKFNQDVTLHATKQFSVLHFKNNFNLTELHSDDNDYDE